MHWKDLRARDDRWLGLELTVARRPTPPLWRVEFASPRCLRLSCEGAPLLWARIIPYYQGLQWLSAPKVSPGPIAPVRAREVDAIREAPGSEAWYAAWGRFFAQALATSSRSPLYEGAWHLLRAFSYEDTRGEPRGDSEVSWAAILRDREGYARQPLAGHVHWSSGYSNLLVGLTPPAELSPSRLHAWRKRARDGTLPPVLAMFITSLDGFVVLDGHHRWMAAIEEQVLAPVLTLCNTEVRHYPPNTARQPVVERLHREQGLGRTEPRSIRVETLNELALEAWAGGSYLVPNTRAWPIPGRFHQWESEVRTRLETLGDKIEPGLRAALLLGPEG